MRKKLFLLLASAGLVFSGCVESDIIEPTLKMQTITVSAGMGTDTKAGVSDSGAFTWHANDAISVLGTDGLYYTLSLTSGAGTKNAEFTGRVPEGVSITTVATYPAIVENGISSTIYDSESKVLKYTLPAEYTYTEGYANVPMVATFEAGAESFSFKHIGALVRIPLNGMPANSKVYVSTTNRKVTGEFLLATDKVGTAEGVIATVTSTTDNAVTVNYTSEVSGQTAEINLPLPVGTYESLSVSVKNAADEEVFTKTWDLGSLEFKRANILVLEAEQVGTIGVSKVYPFFVDARVFWAKAKDVEKYALYVDDASEPVIVSTNDLTVEENGYSYMIGGKFAHNSTHTVSVAPVINNEPLATLKSDAIEFTTGNIMQMTNGTGTRFICAGWDDVALGVENAPQFIDGRWTLVPGLNKEWNSRGYRVQLFAEDKETLIYDEIPFAGMYDYGGAFTTTAQIGKLNGKSALMPTALTFGWLEPGKKYYFRVQALNEPVVFASVADGLYENKGKSYTLISARGGSAWSDYVEMSTDEAYVLGENDILHEGFDDMFFNSDVLNLCPGVIPDFMKATNNGNSDYMNRASADLYKEWLALPFDQRKFAEQAFYRRLSSYQHGLTDETYTSSDKGREFNELAGSLKGWSVYSGEEQAEVYPAFGAIRLGGKDSGGKMVAEIRTAPLNSDKLFEDKLTTCVATLQVTSTANKYSESITRRVRVSVYRNNELISSEIVDYSLDGEDNLSQAWQLAYTGTDSNNYTNWSQMFEVKVNLNIQKGDVIGFSKVADTPNQGFLVISDIKLSISDDEIIDDPVNNRYYGTAPDNTNYDVWGLNGKLPITFWMGPPALDQTPLHTLDAETLATYKSTYFDPIVEGGYTLVECSNPWPESMEILLGWCAESGIRLIDKSISAWNDPEGNVTRVAQYADHNSYAGIFVGKDEPGYREFSEIVAMNTAFKNSIGHIARNVNLYPSYANLKQLNSGSLTDDGSRFISTYAEYVQEFVSQMDMTDHKFNLMLDHYCLEKSRSDGTTHRGKLKSMQYYDLDVVRGATLSKRAPFLMITHGRPQWEQYVPSSPTETAPTAAKPDEHVYDEQRWLVWSQLALGSKGVSYFCYWTPAGFNGGPFSWTTDGEKTRMYDILKNINQEIQPIGQILMTCHADGAMMTNPNGNFTLYMNDGMGLDNYGPVLDLSRGNEEDVVAGCFRDSATGEYKVLVTHKAPATSDTEAATPSVASLKIDTTMASEVKLHTVTLTSHNAAASTVVTTADVSSGTLTLSIPDGTAVLVEFPETANVNYN